MRGNAHKKELGYTIRAHELRANSEKCRTKKVNDTIRAGSLKRERTKSEQRKKEILSMGKYHQSKYE